MPEPGATTIITPAAAGPRIDRWFYIGVALLMILFNVVAFAPSLIDQSRRNVHLPLSPLVTLHAAVSAIWLLLFLGQATLAATRRAEVHRRLGLLGALLTLVFVVIGYFTTVAQARRGFDLSGDISRFTPPGATVPAEATLAGTVGLLFNFTGSHRSRTAMQNDQGRIGDVLPADHHPLIDPAKANVLGLRDAVDEDVAVWTPEWLGMAELQPAVDDAHCADEEPHHGRHEPHISQEQSAGGDGREPEDRARRQHSVHRRGHEQASGTVVQPDDSAAGTVACPIPDRARVLKCRGVIDAAVSWAFNEQVAGNPEGDRRPPAHPAEYSSPQWVFLPYRQASAGTIDRVPASHSLCRATVILTPSRH